MASLFCEGQLSADRVFYDPKDLNGQAPEWRSNQNGTYRRTVDGAGGYYPTLSLPGKKDLF